MWGLLLVEASTCLIGIEMGLVNHTIVVPALFGALSMQMLATALCSSLAINHELVEAIVQIIFAVLGGTVAGGVAGRLFIKGSWDRGVGRSFIITVVFAFTFVPFDYFNSRRAEDLDHIKHPRDDNANQEQLQMLAFIILGVVINMHASFSGRVFREISSRTGNGMWRWICMVMFVMLTFFVFFSYIKVRPHLTVAALTVTNTHSFQDHAEDQLSEAEILGFSLICWLISFKIVWSFGWATSRAPLYHLCAASRCTSQLIWMGETALHLFYFNEVDL